MAKRILFEIIFCLVIMPWVSGSALAFRTSDLEGTWYGYLAEVDTDGDGYWIRLKLNIDSSGNVATTSTYTDPSGPAGNFTGGNLSLDSSGKLSGSLEIYSVDVTIHDGKMDRGKTVASFAYTTYDNGVDALGEGQLIKDEGSFETGNLEGTWHGYYLAGEPGVDAYWIYATLKIDSSGDVIASGSSFTTPYGSENFTGGSLSLTPSGILDGTIYTSVPDTTVDIIHGKMDQRKTIAGFVDEIISSSRTEYDVGLFIKAEGSFHTSDLRGTWHGYFTEIDTSSALEGYWVYATIHVDSSGAVTGGSFTYPTGSGSFTGGSLSLDGSGKLSGNLITNYDTITIRDGKMDREKTVVGFAAGTSSDIKRNVGVFIKAGMAGGSVGSQLLLLLD